MRVKTDPGTGYVSCKRCANSTSDTSSGGSLIHPQISIEEALLGQISNNSLKWCMGSPSNRGKDVGEGNSNSVSQGGAVEVFGRVETDPSGPGVHQSDGHWLALV